MNLSIGSPDFELALVSECRIDEIGEKLDVDNNLNSKRFFEIIDEVKIKFIVVLYASGSILKDAQGFLVLSFLRFNNVDAVASPVSERGGRITSQTIN
ncbi:hypothetical protein [Comamonas koreensis]|uniref:Uncharacterized protein n=1 Tax=Comamonas koreensis TaxID=160825 RepID=A0AAW4XXE7_9BURK|nr:hypothetical protein [Comamonas koreensis]MCD2165359.1 hypothetical protein [Comamonas koreensis]